MSSFGTGLLTSLLPRSFSHHFRCLSSFLNILKGSRVGTPPTVEREGIRGSVTERTSGRSTYRLYHGDLGKDTEYKDIFDEPWEKYMWGSKGLSSALIPCSR